MTDLRRETYYVNKRHDEYGRLLGRTVLWACFDRANSLVDETYNESIGRAYKTPIKVPLLWITAIEGVTNYTPDRLRTTDQVRAALSLNQARGVGMADPTSDDERIHDVFRYRGQWYQISDWEVRADSRGDDWTIGLSGFQFKPGEDFPYDTYPS